MTDTGHSPGAAPRQPSTEASATLGRLGDLLERGVQTDADVAWFVGPYGLLHCCRMVATGDGPDGVLADPRLELVLADVEDRLMAMAGPGPAARGQALVALATAHSPAQKRAAATALTHSIIGQPKSVASTAPDTDGGAEAGVVSETGLTSLAEHAVADLQELLIASSPSASDQTHSQSLHGPSNRLALSITIAVSTHARGELIRLDLARIDGGEPGVAPDLVAAPFQRYDGELLAAISDAYAAAGVTGAYRFHFSSARTGLPLDAVGGRSAGLGAAVGLRCLAQGRPDLIDPRWVFTGGIGRNTQVVALNNGDGLGGYRQKLPAAAGRTLVLPAADLPAVGRLVEEHAVEAVGIVTLEQAERVVARHHEATAAYRRTIGAPTRQPGRRRDLSLRGRRGRPVVGLALLALAAVGMFAAGVVGLVASLGSESTLPAALREIRAENQVIRLPWLGAGAGPGDDLQLLRTEISNAQYSRCVESGVCARPIGEEVRPLREPEFGAYPVTGITAADAEVFCRWAYGEDWGLPTFEQLRAATLQAPAQFPFGSAVRADPAELGNDATGLPDEAAKVDDPELPAGEPAYLSGNVMEWTRTTCVEDTCWSLASVADLSVGRLRIFGISFATLADEQGDEWLNVEAKSDSLFPAADGARDIGARCAKVNAEQEATT